MLIYSDFCVVCFFFLFVLFSFFSEHIATTRVNMCVRLLTLSLRVFDFYYYYYSHYSDVCKTNKKHVDNVYVYYCVPYVDVGMPLNTIDLEPCFYEDVNPLMCK